MLSHLGGNRCLLSWGLFLGDTDGLAGLSGRRLLWPSLRPSICGGALLGCSWGTLGDCWEDSGSGVSYMCCSAWPNELRAEL